MEMYFCTKDNWWLDFSRSKGSENGLRVLNLYCLDLYVFFKNGMDVKENIANIWNYYYKYK